MARIVVVPERMLDLSQQMRREADRLREIESSLGRALGALEWEVRHRSNVEGQVQTARGQARALAERAEEMARFLAERATAFQQADAEGAQSLGAVTEPYLRPVPTPVPAPSPPSGPSPDLPLADIIHSLDDLLKPIDWIADSRRASRSFDKTLEEVGRLLNKLIGKRGHIKMMRQLGDFLQDTAKGVGFLSNFVDLKDMNRYFSGQLTNAEIARIAIKGLIPIPFLDDRIAGWAVQNMPDPAGRWHGLVRPAE